jgi:AraC-like DNA-binding protein
MTMTETPGDVIETPPRRAEADHRDALLSDLLSHIRLSGALFLRGSYSEPWAFDTPGNCDLAAILSPSAERLLVFHTVRRGSVRITVKGREMVAGPGEMVVLPHADRHLLSGREPAEPVQVQELLPVSPWNDIPMLTYGGGGEVSELVCGYFRSDELLFNAVLRRLPPVFVIRPSGRVAALLEAAVDYALEDGSRSGGMTAMDHVTGLLLREALRLHAEDTSDANGWLAATSDPVVSRALKLLHDDPTRDWSAEELARQANTSRSVLGGRFKALLGQSPIRYLVEWRMQIAADLLRTTSLKLAAIAEQTGYGSEAAFSRAFHRHVGQWPAEWRGAMSALH